MRAAISEQDELPAASDRPAGTDGIPRGSEIDRADALGVGQDDPAESRRAPARARYCYIIGTTREGPLKIGVANNPERRRATLQTGSAAELKDILGLSGSGAAPHALVTAAPLLTDARGATAATVAPAGHPASVASSPEA